MLIRARGGALVITSSQVLPQRLSLALELSPESTLQVRPFTREDIKAFLAVRGCPEPDPASSWAGIIYLHTQGHPQLVHARIAALEASGFPVPGPLDLTDTPPDVLEARAEGRRLLTTLDSEARSLVYRLSLTADAVQRPQVLAIANQPPAIAEPGLALDRLVGPWLETVVDGFYRVSPLVRDAGMQILGQDWAEAMHRSITRALLGFLTLSPIDVSMVLFHGIAAKDWAALAHLSRGILNSDDATFDALASTADWFVHVGIGIGVARPTADEYSLVLIRMLQYRLAAADKDHRAAAAIIDRVDAEIPPGSGDRGLQILRHLFLGQVLIRTEVQLPVSRVVSIGREYAHLSDSLGELRAPFRGEKLDPVMRGPNGGFDIGMIASFALALRISDRTALSDLLDVCDSLDPVELRRLLWFIGNREPVAWPCSSASGYRNGREKRPTGSPVAAFALERIISPGV